VDEALKRIAAKKARMRAVVVLLSVLLVLGTGVFVAMTFAQGATARPQLAFLKVGTLERTYSAKALLVRDETVYNANATGTLRPMTSEGSRVATGGLLAYLTPKNGLSTLSDLNDLAQQIADLQRDLMLRGKGTAARAIFDEADQNLAVLAERIRRLADRSDLTGVSRISSSIGILIDRRDADLSTVDFQDARLDQLLAKKTSLEQALGLASTSLFASRPGIVAYETDGLEAALPLDCVTAITAADILSRLSTVPKRVDGSKEVAAGVPVLKTIEGPYQYFAMVVQGVDASSFIQEKMQTVRFPSDLAEPIEARVVRSENTESGVLLVLRTDLLVERFADRRTEDVLLVVRTDEGLKVSVSSFVSYDREKKTAVLKVVKDGYVRLADMRVLAADRDEAIVESLPDAAYPISAYGILVVDPTSIVEGEFIG